MATEHDAVFLYQSACDVFDARVRQVGAEQWRSPTPCSDWDVRHLVNHVTVEDLWAPELLAGRTMGEVGDAFAGDQLGEDPVAVWRAAVAAAKAAAGEPGVPGRVVHLSYGDDSATTYLMQLFSDHLIHSWDLASGIGADRRLPADLVAACAAWFAGVEQVYRSAGMIGPKVPVDEGADAQTRLLASYGRRG